MRTFTPSFAFPIFCSPKLDGRLTSGFSRPDRSAATIGVRLLVLAFCLAALVSFPTAEAQTANGLLAWYPLNGSYTNFMGTGMDGTNSGGLSWTTNRFGAPGSACEFYGTNHIGISDPLANLNFDASSRDYTIALWIRLNATNSYQTFIEDRGRTGSDPLSYGLQYEISTNRFSAQVWSGGGAVVRGTTSPSPGVWYHLAMVVTNKIMRFYVNGADESTPANQPASFATANSTGVRNIGRYNGGAPDFYLKGAVDDVRIYGRALNTQEIQGLTNDLFGAREIKGVVSYAGTQTGDVWVLATTNSTSWSTNYAVKLSSPADYSLWVPASVTNWWIKAFRDVNNNATNDIFEAKGECQLDLSIATNLFRTNVNIVLIDPDTDGDGLSDYAEVFVYGTNPLSADTDGDGLPDKWEVDNGTQPTVSDAGGDVDTDGLNNALEFRFGTKANNPDTDGDGLSDYNELFVHGTNPLLADTDGDGMPDDWEIANGLKPLRSDANEDRDLDGLTNLQEYTNRALGYLANNAGSRGGGKSDFEWFYGSQTNRYYYDKTDRLVGAEHNHGSNGLSIAYVYDGNGNIRRQEYLSRDANANGLPDLWEFLNGLTNNAPADVDTDGDGWTDFQEWRAGSNPLSAASTPTTPALAFDWPFASSNLVMAVGQLNEPGSPEEIMLSAAGTSASGSNIVLVARYENGAWTNECVSIGDLSVMSAVVGQVTNRPGPAIYLGVRQSNGRGGILELSPLPAGWQQTIVSEFPSPFVDLAGFTPRGSLLAVFSPYAANWEMLHETWPEGGVWIRRIADPKVSQGAGTAMFNELNRAIAPHVVREVMSNALCVASPGAMFDDFDDGVINPSLWTTSGVATASATWSMGESDGLLTINTDTSFNGNSSRSANAQVICTNLWAGGYRAALIRISQAGVRKDTASSITTADIGVQLGGAYLYRYQRTVANGTVLSDQANTGLIHVVQLGTNSYSRLQTNSASWSAWTALGTVSSQLTFNCAIASANDVTANSVLRIDSVELCTPDSIAYPTGSPDLQSSSIAYDSALGRWLIGSHSSANWLTSEQWAGDVGGDLVRIQSAAENTKAKSLISTNSWIGAYWDATLTRWSWPGGQSLTFSNWAAGQPAFSGPGAAVFMDTNGSWNVGTNTMLLPAIMQTGPRWIGPTISNLASSTQLGIQRPPLVVANVNPLQTNQVIVFRNGIEDFTANGVLDSGDYLTNRAVQVGAGIYAELPAQSISLDGLNSTRSVASAFVYFTNINRGTFFTAAPDGRVYLWNISGLPASLSPTLFSDYYRGYSWYALSGHRMGVAEQGLVGLRSSRSDPRKCGLVYWPPKLVMPAPETVPQSAPIASVLPSTNTLGNLASLTVRLWDAEGNSSTPFLQYQFTGSTNWFDATLPSLDGLPYSPTSLVAANPSGSSHTLVWDARTDLGSGVTTNLLLRARARDFTLIGDWSAGTPASVQTTANPDNDNDGLLDAWEIQYFSNTAANPNDDPDGDGFKNWQEYVADTNPTNALSYLHITSATRTPSGLVLNWQGGINATQFIERLNNLTTNNWQQIFTNLPPTPISGSYTDAPGTNTTQFYRIKATR